MTRDAEMYHIVVHGTINTRYGADYNIMFVTIGAVFSLEDTDEEVFGRV